MNAPSAAALEAILNCERQRPSLAFDATGRLLWRSVHLQSLEEVPKELSAAAAAWGMRGLAKDRVSRKTISIHIGQAAAQADLMLTHARTGEPIVVALLEPDLDPDSVADDLGKRARLTAAERRVLLGMLSGRPYRSIARRLGISLETVRTHTKHVLAKLGVPTRLELLRQLPHFRQ